jgi:hypothetical protein
MSKSNWEKNMSSHREAPSLRLGTAFTGVSALAALPLSTLVSDEILVSGTDTVSNLYANINITDLYAFQKPGDVSKAILIMNVNPMPPKLADAFDPGSIYEFRIDTNGDAVADVALRITFSSVESGQQFATIRRASGPEAAEMGDGGDILLQNAPVSFDSNPRITTVGDYSFFAGLRSDPFFFDLMGFCNNLSFTGADYFLHSDVFGIVLEVPNTAFGEYRTLGIWSRVQYYHHDEWLQAERLALPLLNILFNSGEDKLLFKETEPAQHRALFSQKFTSLLVKLGRSSQRAQEITQMLLPDMLSYDPVSSGGFFYIKPVARQGKTWDEIPAEIKETFERLGIPQAEQKYLAGVTAQYEITRCGRILRSWA